MNRNAIDYELNEWVHDPRQWLAIRKMKEQAHTMLWAYRQTILDKIESYGEGFYTHEELVASISSGEAFDWWMREYQPTDRVIYIGIYGDKDEDDEEVCE